MSEADLLPVNVESVYDGHRHLLMLPGARSNALAGEYAYESLSTGAPPYYIIDDVGGGRAVVTADMLLLLRGEAGRRHFAH